jgi:integrase
MSVRKRSWTTQSGEAKEAFVVDYTDQNGERHIQTFDRKKDADEYHAKVKVDIGKGIHTPHSKSITVAEAAEDWIKYVELEKRERSTVEQYRNHVDNHITPRIGGEKLAKLTTPRIQAFRDDLLASLSRAQAKKVLTSLKSLLKDAQRRGNVAQNVALSVSIKRDNRAKSKLKVGVDIPTPDEIKRIIHAATGRARPFLITAIFTGLRSSELRGLRWGDLNLGSGELHVRQRVDRYIRSWRACRAAGTAGCEYAAGMAAGLPEGQSRSGFPQHPGEAMGSRRSCHPLCLAGHGRGRCHRCRGRAKVQRPSCAPALLSIMVHQSEG